MEPEFITYQRFNEAELANLLIAILEENDIPFIMSEEGPVFDPSFSFREDISHYAVKIRSEDFERVSQLLEQNESNNQAINEDYYLFDFTDEELKEVLEKADEWNAFDISLAKRILAERGKPVNDAELLNLKSKRLEELKKPEHSQRTWIILGYIFAFVGSILGLFIGWHLFKHKKTLPNGERVYGYTEHDRKQGTIIFLISLAGIVIFVILKAVAAYHSAD